MVSDAASAEILFSVSRQLNASLDLDEVLGNVLRLTVDATKAMRGSLFLLNKEGEVIRRILARPNQSASVSEEVISKVMTKGLAGWVYRHRAPALIPNTAKDERWVRLPNDKAIIGAAIMVPLIYRNHVNGLLALHHETVNFFTDADLQLTMRIAEQAAISLENARLFTEVKNEREALFALIRGMPIPVLVISGQELTFRNGAAQRALLMRESAGPLMSIEGGEKILAALTQLQRNHIDRVEVRWLDNRVFNVSINEVSQHGTVVALDDITYLKELDVMKSSFVETVSHDLKNPLSIIQGFGTLLQHSPNLSDIDRDNLNNILQGANQMQALIENLLDLAQIEAGVDDHVELCDLIEIAHDALDNYKMQVKEKELTISADWPDEISKIRADAVRLSQIVSNYISNAIKYTPAGGEIRLCIREEGAEIKFCVIDSGPGIPPAAQAQLFQKFYRVPRDNGEPWVEGTGLGLSIVKAIAESYGGRVWVESEVGVGSTFGCALPIKKEANGQTV